MDEKIEIEVLSFGSFFGFCFECVRVCFGFSECDGGKKLIKRIAFDLSRADTVRYGSLLNFKILPLYFQLWQLHVCTFKG
jgi:hypothetical protein